MKLEFEKHHTEHSSSARITDTYRIYVDIIAVSRDEKKLAYAVQNMAYSLGYTLTKKEEN